MPYKKYKIYVKVIKMNKRKTNKKAQNHRKEDSKIL